MLKKRIDYIKSLNELLLDNNIELEYNFRKFIKDLFNGSFDVCIENLKDSLKKEGLLSIP